MPAAPDAGVGVSVSLDPLGTAGAVVMICGHQHNVSTSSLIVLLPMAWYSTTAGYICNMSLSHGSSGVV